MNNYESVIDDHYEYMTHNYSHLESLDLRHEETQGKLFGMKRKQTPVIKTKTNGNKFCLLQDRGQQGR